jgi:hypothetical protein
VPLCANPKQPTSKQQAERLALEKPLPPRIIKMKSEDFVAFREVLDEYKFRNLLAVADSKLTTKEDIARYF